MDARPGSRLEERILEWRSYLLRRGSIRSADVEEMEDHLRGQVASFVDVGLREDEAFLVAVGRMGEVDALSREFAREHSERLWKQLVASPAAAEADAGIAARERWIVFALAVAAGASIKVPELFGVHIADWDAGIYPRNLALFVFPFVAAYFVWKRRISLRVVAVLAVSFAAGAAFADAYPFGPDAHTQVLTALHLPIALWLVVGLAYAGGRWREAGRRMDFVRFSGELFIYYVLIAMGGAVLIGFTGLMFRGIGMNVQWLAREWILPCGAMGAVLVSAWLVEAKQSVIENMAPVLTRVFTPLFAILLLTFLATMAFTGRVIDVQRDVLIAFDLLLAVVVGLLLYAASARDPVAPPDLFDTLQLLLALSALAVDALALAAIAARITDFGFTPNRVAALGENIILLVSLCGSAVHYARFIRGRSPFAVLERWETAYLPVYSLWAAVVVVAFPPFFGFS